MAIELDNIKLDTTWNDAAGSINNNFSKVKQAIATLIAEGGGLDEEQLAAYLQANGYTTEQWIALQEFIKLGSLDTEIKADSVNAVQNKAIKAYVDKAAQEAEYAAIKGALEGLSADEIYIKYIGDKMSLLLAQDGGLGTPEGMQGLGIVSIPEGLLSDYAKNEEISNTFATIAALNLVSGRLTAIEGYFSTEEDADTYINKWNEIVAFLNATEGTTLDNILSSKADKSDIPTRVSQLENDKGYITSAAIANKVDKEDGKGLSSNDYTDAEKSKLASIADGAEVNVQADWNATSGDAFIKNKPTIPAAVTESTVAGWGFTKNTGTYIKPSTGIPKSDLASDVQTSLGKADTALQEHQSLAGYATQTWVNQQGFLKSASLSGYAKTADLGGLAFLDAITSKMVTDALGFTPFDSAAFTKTSIKNALGIADWALAASKPSYNFSDIGNRPTTLSGYGITDALVLAPASEHRATTDNSAFATYAYGDNGWIKAGPALAFANGNYKGLLNISIGNGESAPTRLWISSVREGTQQPWVEVLTEANISSLAMVAGQAGISSGQDLNDLFIPGSYHIAGGPTNAPQEAGDGSLLVVATKHRVFSSQLLVGWNGVLYLRGAEGNSWKNWRTVLDTTNIGTVSLPSLNLNGETITSWNDLKASGDYLPLTGGTISGSLSVSGSVYLYSNLKISAGGAFQLGNEDGISKWSDLKSKIAYSFSEISSKPTTLSGYGITDALVLAPASEHRATTDNSAFATYAYGDNGWIKAGPALAFANGNYKGLLNISIGNGESAPTRMWLSSVREGTQQPWVEVLTEANISSLAMVAGQAGISSGQDLNDLFIPGSYHIAGGPTNAPQEAGDGSLLVVATKHRVFSSQLLVGWNGVLYLRGAEGNSWKNWRTVLDTTNIGTVSLPSLNLNGETITSWNDLKIKEVSQTATSGTVSIAPNVLNKWSSALTGTLTITFVSGASGVANYYMLEFTTGSSIPTITLPSGVKWEGGYNILDSLEPNTTYQISILNNLAVGGAF